MDVIRYTQGKMIEWDATMMSVSRGVGAKFHRSALTEELGQVSYIMSDKTGTLT
jgi:magnesium-transporting ATPase (P-type)